MIQVRNTGVAALHGRSEAAVKRERQQHSGHARALRCTRGAGRMACTHHSHVRASALSSPAQFSSGGSQFYAGKGLDNTNYRAAIAGAVSGAYHVRAMAEQYGVPVSGGRGMGRLGLGLSGT